MSYSCGSSSTNNGYSNLEHFLYSVTPIVPSTTLSQNYIGDVNCTTQQHCKDKSQYFTLGDLWECYSEWSAYGVQTRILSNAREPISQFFVPYLSALQIYSNNKYTVPSRTSSDSTEFETDSWSDDSTSDNLSRSLSNNSSRGWDGVSEDSSVDLESLWSIRDNNYSNKLGCLYFHYVETSYPHLRPPLIDKVTELAQHYPGLMTLKSIDLCPASWMAVAWYPIYSIPCRKNEKDLSTSFITYHTLSSSFEDCESEDNIATMEEKSKVDSCYYNKRASLSPFGLASYKMEGDLWLSKRESDYERKSNLYSAADSWLKQLNVHHHDFNFFSHHSPN